MTILKIALLAISLATTPAAAYASFGQPEGQTQAQVASFKAPEGQTQPQVASFSAPEGHTQPQVA